MKGSAPAGQEIHALARGNGTAAEVPILHHIIEFNIRHPAGHTPYRKCDYSPHTH